ncbi:ALG6, ALG8 glycosyltransferase, partial [Panus rudis PR-1116 ss-1]
LRLAKAVILEFLASLGPFILMGQLSQLLSRLFPFTRGLNHAYWAPNVWPLVAAADPRLSLSVTLRFGIDSLNINTSGVASTSRGLVGDTVFAVIPNIKSMHTFIITILFQAIFLIKLWRIPSYKSFFTALTLCGYTSFMFGWHVHEKAILPVLVPLRYASISRMQSDASNAMSSLLAAENHAYFRTFMTASIAGIFSLFPLLFTPAETLVKVVHSIIWGILVFEPINRRVYE